MRHVIFKEAGGASRPHALGHDDVFNSDGDAGQGAKRLARGEIGVDALGGGKSSLWAEVQERAIKIVLGLGEADGLLGQFLGAETAVAEPLPDGADRECLVVIHLAESGRVPG